MTDPKPVVCEACGEEGMLTIARDTTEYYDVVELDDDHVVGCRDTKAIEQPTYTAHMFCTNCGTEFPVPGNYELEYYQ